MILFLDFDGVLHPLNREHGVMSRMPQFESVMRDHSEVDIVVSSAWREAYNLAELRSHFAPDMRVRIIDVTPILNYLDHSYVRQAEIMTWLRDNGREYESWVALDDSDWLFSPQCSNLILVNTEIGFDDTTEQILRKRLSR